MTQNKQYTERHKTNNTQNDTKQTIHRTTQQFGRVRAVPRLGWIYPGFCLTTEEKVRKNLSQGSRVQLQSEKQDFVEMNMSDVLRDLCLTRNQPVK